MLFSVSSPIEAAPGGAKRLSRRFRSGSLLTEGAEHPSFHVLVGRLCIFFGDLSIRVLSGYLLLLLYFSPWSSDLAHVDRKTPRNCFTGSRVMDGPAWGTVASLLLTPLRVPTSGYLLLSPSSLWPLVPPAPDHACGCPPSSVLSSQIYWTASSPECPWVSPALRVKLSTADPRTPALLACSPVPH